MPADRCSSCATPRVVTRDAIGRPRVRCPRCQGVAICGRAQPSVYVNQAALSSRDLRPELVTPPPPAPIAAPAPPACVVCGVPLVRIPGRGGRPTKRCEAHQTKWNRWKRAQRAAQLAAAGHEPARS